MGVVARRAVARVMTPEEKVAAGVTELKEVVVEEVEKAPLQESMNFEEETKEGEEEEESEEELEAEEEVLVQDHMAIDEEDTVQATTLHQVDDQDLDPPTKIETKLRNICTFFLGGIVLVL